MSSIFDGETRLVDPVVIPTDVAAAALAFLRRRGAVDCADALGLAVAE